MQMAFAPRADLTKRLLTGAKSLVPLAVLYGILLVASWTPETLSTLLPGDFAEGMKSALQGQPKMQFLPEIQAVGKLLSAPIASVSAWAHLQFIAFFCARWIWMDGACLLLSRPHARCHLHTCADHITTTRAPLLPDPITQARHMLIYHPGAKSPQPQTS